MQLVNGHGSRLHFQKFAGAGAGIGGLAVDLQRREGRRHLLDRAGEAGQDRLDLRRSGVDVTGGDHLALGVERIGLGAKRHAKGILLGRVEHAASELGGLADGDGQDAAGERIEGSAMTDLGLGLAGIVQRALDRADRLGRAEPHRLVEDDPAVETHAPAIAVLRHHDHLRATVGDTRAAGA
jgi:hypothetical protein